MQPAGIDTSILKGILLVGEKYQKLGDRVLRYRTFCSLHTGNNRTFSLNFIVGVNLAHLPGEPYRLVKHGRHML